MSIFNNKQPKIEITLKNGKKIHLTGELTTTFNWAIIENKQNTTIINREGLIYIKKRNNYD